MIRGKSRKLVLRDWLRSFFCPFLLQFSSHYRAASISATESRGRTLCRLPLANVATCERCWQELLEEEAYKRGRWGRREPLLSMWLKRRRRSMHPLCRLVLVLRHHISSYRVRFAWMMITQYLLAEMIYIQDDGTGHLMQMTNRERADTDGSHHDPGDDLAAAPSSLALFSLHFICMYIIDYFYFICIVLIIFILFVYH
ncbi:uncharacterized protein LOC131163919 [Malania oleifera]|uniref:uncharacterized protein LOC131163919 n=1 Tax=Malania oleifera TaxID=397392 RepID=UPI0025AEC27C|nr:uncharacterized protein LOC131163919 [Malania oleifera]